MPPTGLEPGVLSLVLEHGKDLRKPGALPHTPNPYCLLQCGRVTLQSSTHKRKLPARTARMRQRTC